jgi:hypothetical protein
MTGPAWLRHQAGRHRGPAAKETALQPSLAAPSPQSGQPTATATLAGPEAPAEPDRIVVCGFCHVSGLSSQIPELAGLRRCGDIDGCVQRSLQEGRPRPLLSAEELVAAVPAEMLAPLPAQEAAETPPVLAPAQEAALAAFEAAHAEEDAAAGQTPGDDGPWLTDACQRGDCEECPDPVECACGHHEQDAAEAARDLAVFLGPEEKGFGPEDPGPAPVADEDAAPDGPAAEHTEEGDA